jgi:hypothetical protein
MGGMSESASEDPKLKEIKNRFGSLQVRIHHLLVEFIYWNDVFRYPDLPEDSERPGRLASLYRNVCNENQIRYLGIAKEESIILNLWALLYDVGEHSEQNLLRLGERLNNPLHFPDRERSMPISLCIRYLKRNSFDDRFSLHRNNFIAHLSSTQPSPDNIVEEKEIYAVVPKTIHLVELVHAELHPYSMHLGNIFKSTARDVAGFFHHSSADPLLVQLFEHRSLPAEEYEQALTTFLNKYVAREKAARDK